MRKALSTLRGAAGTGALILMAGTIAYGGYLFFSSVSDLKRYRRIATM